MREHYAMLCAVKYSAEVTKLTRRRAEALAPGAVRFIEKAELNIGELVTTIRAPLCADALVPALPAGL